MRAVKGNKEYTIDESQKKSYQDSGFDIVDDTGTVIAYGRGKTVPYGDYVSIKAENEKLRKELENLQTSQEKGRAAKKAGE